MDGDARHPAHVPPLANPPIGTHGPTASSGRKGRRLGLPPQPPSSMVGLEVDGEGAAQGLADGGVEGVGGTQGRAKPPRKPPVAGTKRKGRSMSTATASAAQRTSTTAAPFDTPPGMYGSRPAAGTIGTTTPASVSPVAQQVLDEIEVPKKKGSRGTNFTVAEDECLVKAWQAITLDPITGTEQPGSTYWSRIYDNFSRNNKSGKFRSQVFASHRWSVIRVSCTKWASCLERVESLNPSGANAQDKVNIAQRLYKGNPKKKGGKPGKAFSLHHCWVLLQYDEKWRTRNNDVPNKSKKSRNSPVDENGENVGTDDDVSDGERIPTPTSAPSSKRPPGRKGEKERLKKAGESTYKESLENMVSSRRELAAERNVFKNTRWMEMKEENDRRTAIEERRVMAEERRATAEEQRAAIEERRVAAKEASKRLEQEQKIMFMDPSNLDEKGRAYYELMRDQILARSMGGF